MDAAGNELKAVRLDLTADLHRELRIEAAKAGVSMAALVRELVVKFLTRKKGKANDT